MNECTDKFVKENSLGCNFCKYNCESKNIKDYQYIAEKYCMKCSGNYNKWEPNKQLYQYLLQHNMLIQKTDAKLPIVILGFPGVGKTYIKEKYKGSNIKVLDSDSSNFDKSDFPNNYIQFITENLSKYDIILCSTHEIVRNAIYNCDDIFKMAKVYICYPELNMKAEWIERLKNRGNNEAFCNLIESNYEKWILDIKLENKFFPLVINQNNKYISSYIDTII